MALADKTLVCRECSASFVFSAGEQEFYQSKGLVNEPGRCPACRAARRSSSSGSGARPEAGRPRTMYPAVCASCGATTEVPFEPRLGRPVYCRDCFESRRSTGA